MRIRTAAAALAAMGLAVGLALAQPEKKPAAPGAAPQPEKQPGAGEMPDMSAKPGPEHERLMRLAGSYAVESKFTGPGMPPQTTTGEATARATLGGRFLEITETGTMMGQPLESVQIWGYNAASKKYESMWRYTMSTAMMSLKGQSGDGGTTIDCDASYDEEGKTERMKVRFKTESGDRFVVTLTAQDPSGKDVVMETIYTRKK
jgi:hypothetical protein